MCPATGAFKLVRGRSERQCGDRHADGFRRSVDPAWTTGLNAPTVQFRINAVSNSVLNLARAAFDFSKVAITINVAGLATPGVFNLVQASSGTMPAPSSVDAGQQQQTLWSPHGLQRRLRTVTLTPAERVERPGP